MTHRIVALVAVACGLFTGIPLHAQQTAQAIDTSIEQNVGNHEEFKTMMATLQQDVREHNGAGVADLVHYPLRTTIHGKRHFVATRANFLKDYDLIVTPPIAQVIDKQKYDGLFVNAVGAMFGDGEVWIAGICQQQDCRGKKDIRIITIQSTANLRTK